MAKTIEELLEKTNELDAKSRLSVSLFIHTVNGEIHYNVMLDDWSTDLSNAYEVSKMLKKLEKIVEYIWS